MDQYRVLLVEDEDDQISMFEDAITVLNAKNATPTLEIIGKHAKTLYGAKEMLCKNFDAIIIDLRLEGEPNNEDGGSIADEIMGNYQIPTVIRTGTPEKATSKSPIDVLSKTDINASFDKLIPFLMDISNTGIFKVLGGKGVFQEKLSEIFWGNLYSKKDCWISINQRLKAEELSEADSITEQLLLRYTVSHLQELLDNAPTHFFPEEAYITPTLSSDIKTGNIKKANNDGSFYIVLSPPCDLAVRANGKCKTDSILLCQIESLNEIHDSRLSKITKNDKKKKVLQNLFKNREPDYYHFLPQVYDFPGGYINFRKIKSFAPAEIKENFENSSWKIVDSIVKDILSRFSSYYARQGQPDFDHKYLVDEWLKKCK